jgi:hypothetical protein
MSMFQAVLIAAILVLLGLVGQMDMKDEVSEEAHYCAMVAEQFWPDYRKDEIECEE